METNARLLPKLPDTQNYMVTLKFNPSHVRRHTLPSQPSQQLITQFRLHIHNLSLQDLQHQKQIQYPMLQIKTLF